jgi:hypothetical protein
MANRHKATGRFAKGGKVPDPEHQAKIEKEAGLKTGGAAKLKTGGAAPTKLKTGGAVPGFKCGGRLDKRARGGGVGADKNPFSSAHLK